MDYVPSISIITATWNAERFLPSLVESLRNQTDKNFDWVIADGGSTDKTLELLNDVGDLTLEVDSQPDFGIYDALNRAVRGLVSDYYLVVGADDYLEPDAIDNYRKAAIDANGPDLVAAAVRIDHTIVLPKAGWGWYYGMGGESSCHSVGLLIKYSLHDEFGLYSRKYPITADQLFIKTVLRNQGSIVRCGFLAGEFATDGASGGDEWGMITELFRVQVKTERWLLVQLLLLFIRCLKCYLRGVIRRVTK